MLTCVIRYEIDPTKGSQFEQYARTWGEAIPRCGADLIGYFAPRKDRRRWPTASTTSRAWPSTKPTAPAWPRIPLAGRTTPSRKRERFILREDRTWLKLASKVAGGGV